MADLSRRATQPLILNRIRAELPTWEVHLTGQEILAVSPLGVDPQAALNHVKGITHEMGLQVLATPRQGRVVVSLDLSGIPRY